jgi:hypothetical protein
MAVLGRFTVPNGEPDTSYTFTENGVVDARRNTWSTPPRLVSSVPIGGNKVMNTYETRKMDSGVYTKTLPYSDFRYVVVYPPGVELPYASSRGEQQKTASTNGWPLEFYILTPLTTNMFARIQLKREPFLFPGPNLVVHSKEELDSVMSALFLKCPQIKVWCPPIQCSGRSREIKEWLDRYEQIFPAMIKRRSR